MSSSTLVAMEALLREAHSRESENAVMITPNATSLNSPKSRTIKERLSKLQLHRKHGRTSRASLEASASRETVMAIPTKEELKAQLEKKCLEGEDMDKEIAFQRPWKRRRRPQLRPGQQRTSAFSRINKMRDCIALNVWFRCRQVGHRSYHSWCPNNSCLRKRDHREGHRPWQ